MKKNFYITAFTFLGYLLQQLAHALLEVGYLRFLVSDFDRYRFGFSWGNLLLIHYIITVLFVVLGLWFGFKQGKYWWVRLYDEHGVRRPWGLTK